MQFRKNLKHSTEQEEQYYVKLLEKNDPDARLVLIERNLRLVAHIAKKYAGPMTSQDDLISIGTIGLIKAVNTYTSKKSTRLATYAAKCIENEILKQIHEIALVANAPQHGFQGNRAFFVLF